MTSHTYTQWQRVSQHRREIYVSFYYSNFNFKRQSSQLKGNKINVWLKLWAIFTANKFIVIKAQPCCHMQETYESSQNFLLTKTESNLLEVNLKALQKIPCGCQQLLIGRRSCVKVDFYNWGDCLINPKNFLKRVCMVFWS